MLPTDTVYGLCAEPGTEAPVREIHRLKERPADQPVALLAKDVDVLLQLVPELRSAAGELLRALLPGRYTLILPNPAQRYPWLTGSSPSTIGVRVPQLSGPGVDVFHFWGCIALGSHQRAPQSDLQHQFLLGTLGSVR